jgi:hypothetical protein
MGTESRKPPGEDDPTDQQEALDYDGTSTDQLDDTYRFRVVAMSESSAGGIDRDDLRRPRWKWMTEGPASAAETDKTFDHLKALDHDALAVKDSAAEPPPAASRKVGYNPYETGPPDKSEPKK